MLDHEERRFLLSVLRKARPHGFSLIELMIAIAIFSITLTFGVSSYRTWVQNTQIRNAAESIQNGIQRTRAEAVKRNTNVAFTLGAGSSWTVSVVSSGEVIDSRPSSEGSKNVTISALDKDDNAATTITLNSLGGVVANANTLARVDLDSSVLDPADSRDLRITIGVNGVGSNVRMCDPNLSAGTSPMAC